MPIPPAKHILIAPLDWGSGHTTRCIPLIRHLRHCGHNVTFAGNSIQESLIKKNFTEIPVVRLEGYNVTYSKHRSGFMPKLMSQVPGLIKTVRWEHRWLQEYACQHPVDGVLSDNRYGLYHDTIPSVIITHQLSLKTGFGAFADHTFRRLHYRLLEKFDHCWVPDLSGTPNLAGSLSHPASLPRHTDYIGLLSQTQPSTGSPDNTSAVLVLLSGPEPQRTILSDLLWQQALTTNREIVFVEGSAKASRRDIPAHIRYHNLVDAMMLQSLMSAASIVICRGGYTTLMELALLKKKAILIPTPGQTEQEYLAANLNANGLFMAAKQTSFELATALVKAETFPFHTLDMPGSHDLFIPVLDQWIAGLP